jgi:hypothetical protein
VDTNNQTILRRLSKSCQQTFKVITETTMLFDIMLTTEIYRDGNEKMARVSIIKKLLRIKDSVLLFISTQY